MCHCIFLTCMSFQFLFLIWVCSMQRADVFLCVIIKKTQLLIWGLSPLTRWCISWTAAWSHSSPPRCRWSRRGARRVSWRPRGLLSVAARPCGSHPPPRSPLPPQPAWCSAETEPNTHTHTSHKCSFYNSDYIKTECWQLKQSYKSGT